MTPEDISPQEKSEKEVNKSLDNVDEVIEELKEELGLKPEVVLCEKGNCKLVKEASGYVLRCGDKETVINVVSKDPDILREIVRLSLMSLGVAGRELFEYTQEFLNALVKDLLMPKPLPSISVEVKHVSEREELYYEVVKKVMENHIIKTFYIPSTTASGKKKSYGDIYCFDGVSYRYCEPELVSEIEKLVSGSEDIDKKTTRWVINEALDKIRRKTLTPLHTEPLKIAFKNVIFDWEKFLESFSFKESVLKPTPDIVSFIRIPHYLPTEALDELDKLMEGNDLKTALKDLAGRWCPKTLEAYKSWVGEDNDRWVLLFEIQGAVLLPKPIKKAFLLLGDTDTGKSTWIRLLYHMVGKDNFTAISLQELVNPEYRFRASRIYRKLLNAYADLPEDAVRNPNTFKVITGEDVLPIEKKYGEPFEWMPYTKHIFSANTPPRVYGTDRAFWNRWLVVKFVGNFSKKIKDFEETLYDEIPYNILLSILAFAGVVKRGWVFTLENTPEDAKREWLMASSSIYAFYITMLEEGVLVEDPKAMVKTSTVYNLYVNWCRENDREPVDHRVFPNETKKIMGYEIKKKEDGTYILGLKLGNQKNLFENKENS